jgi:hypothetical protein
MTSRHASENKIMKPHYVILAAIAATGVFALAASADPLPSSWILYSPTPGIYEGGVDQSHDNDTQGSKFIRYAKGDTDKWATIMQQISAENYRGKRVRFQGQIKTKDVSSWSGFWLRIDTPTPPTQRIYNSQDKPIKGSTSWQPRSIVLDVPADAGVVSFGVIQAGLGEVWIKDLKLEIVGTDVPVDVQAPPKMALTPSL